MNKISINNNLDNTLSNNTCSSCSANSTCGVGLLSKFFKRKNNIKSSYISEKDFIFNSFLLYLVPIISLIFGSVIANILYPKDNIIAIIFAITFFIVGILSLNIKKLFYKHHQSQNQ